MTLSKLQWLYLNQTSVTDNTMRQLTANRLLKFLSVVETSVTADGVALIHKELPSVRVRR